MNILQSKKREIHNPYQIFQNEEEDLSKEPDKNKPNNFNLKVLTYNFFLRPPPIKTNEDDYKEERLNDFYPFLKQFDIICMQEVFGAVHNRKNKLIQKARENGLFYYMKSNSPSLFSKCLIDGGLLILSKYPILESNYIDYDYCVLSDSLCSKGVIFVKIKILDFYLCIFNTHLQASYFDAGQKFWDLCIKVRKEQSEKLINFIYSTIYKMKRDDVLRSKFILLGDFNIDAHDYKETRSKFNLSKGIISEYESFKLKLNKLGKAIDLFENKFKEHPFTFGVNDKNYDKVLTGKIELNSHQTIDYIWEIIPDLTLPIFNLYNDYTGKNGIIPLNDNSNLSNFNFNNIDKKLEILYDSPEVETFLVENRPYQQLSDHFGLSIQLSINLFNKMN